MQPQLHRRQYNFLLFLFPNIFSFYFSSLHESWSLLTFFEGGLRAFLFHWRYLLSIRSLIMNERIDFVRFPMLQNQRKSGFFIHNQVDMYSHQYAYQNQQNDINKSKQNNRVESPVWSTQIWENKKVPDSMKNKTKIWYNHQSYKL